MRSESIPASSRAPARPVSMCPMSTTWSSCSALAGTPSPPGRRRRRPRAEAAGQVAARLERRSRRRLTLRPEPNPLSTNAIFERLARANGRTLPDDLKGDRTMNRCLAILCALLFAFVSVSSACIAAPSDWIGFDLEAQRDASANPRELPRRKPRRHENNWSNGFKPSELDRPGRRRVSTPPARGRFASP